MFDLLAHTTRNNWDFKKSSLECKIDAFLRHFDSYMFLDRGYCNPVKKEETNFLRVHHIYLDSYLIIFNHLTYLSFLHQILKIYIYYYGFGAKNKKNCYIFSIFKTPQTLTYFYFLLSKRTQRMNRFGWLYLKAKVFFLLAGINSIKYPRWDTCQYEIKIIYQIISTTF